MEPLVYQVAGGVLIVPATVALAAVILAGAIARRRWVAIPGLVIGLLAVAAIVVSAPAMPWGFDGIWAGSILVWIGTRRAEPDRPAWWRALPRATALACTVAGGAVELAYERWSPLPPGHATTLCVVGDSVTAGLGRRGETTWPTLLRAAHGVRIVDLSRAGCTVRQAVRLAARVARETGIALIEVGGNDVIGRADPQQFGGELESLAQAVQSPGRQVVMFELPRFPFDDAYGVQQRRVANRYGIHLVPRRLFAAVLAGPGSTVDGVHLSNAGQQRLAELVWRVVGPAMGG